MRLRAKANLNIKQKQINNNSSQAGKHIQSFFLLHCIIMRCTTRSQSVTLTFPDWYGIIWHNTASSHHYVALLLLDAQHFRIAVIFYELLFYWMTTRPHSYVQKLLFVRRHEHMPVVDAVLATGWNESNRSKFDIILLYSFEISTENGRKSFAK